MYDASENGHSGAGEQNAEGETGVRFAFKIILYFFRAQRLSPILCVIHFSKAYFFCQSYFRFSYVFQNPMTFFCTPFRLIFMCGHKKLDARSKIRIRSKIFQIQPQRFFYNRRNPMVKCALSCNCFLHWSKV